MKFLMSFVKAYTILEKCRFRHVKDVYDVPEIKEAIHRIKPGFNPFEWSHRLVHDVINSGLRNKESNKWNP